MRQIRRGEHSRSPRRIEESYCCPSGLAGFACSGDVAGAGVAVLPVGSASPFIEARICSSRECPAICTLACSTSIMRPCTEFCASSACPRALA